MDPLSVSASIIALLQLSSTVIGYLSSVKSGPKELQSLRLELCSILPLLSILQGETEQAKSGSLWSTTLLSLGEPNGPIEQFQAALEMLELRLSPIKGWKKVGKAFTWPLERTETLRILGTIERQKLLFTLARQNDHMTLAKAIKSDVETVHEKIDEIGEGVVKLHFSDKHHDIRRWLSGPDPSSNYNQALQKRHAGTGSWLFDNVGFRDWKQDPGPSSVFWLYGIPGCGKTILCSTVLEHVLQSYAQTANVAVLYFFFDFQDIDKQQHEVMMRSLLNQLCMHCASVPPVLEALYTSCMDGGRKPTFEALLKSLHQLAATFRKTFLILDALDECKARPELLASIEALVSWEGTNLRVLVTSRREKDIEASMLHLSKAEDRICIQSTLTDSDIRAYVHDQVQTNKRLKRWQKEPKVQMEIEDTLMSKVDGMFRWAACQLDLLGNCLTLPKLRKALATLPRTLYETYARILCNIDEEHQEDALHILQWLAFSERPLQLKEIAEVVAIDVNNHPQFHPRRRLPDPEDVVTICSSLITVTQNSSTDVPSRSLYPHRHVALAHSSVKEYLVSDLIRQGQDFKYSLNEMDCHVSLTKDCLAYLLHFDEVGSLRSDVFAEYPLVQYAAMYLSAHARVAENKDQTICQGLFLTKGEAFINWIILHDLQRAFRSDIPGLSRHTASPLFYASVAGLFESVKMLIEEGAAFHFQDGDYGDALIAASSQGYVEIVKLLLEKIGHLDTMDSSYRNASRLALSRGHTEIVHILLEKGFDVNEPADYVFLAAIKNHDEEKAQSLIGNRTDIARKDHAQLNSLNFASHEGLQEGVEFIFQKHVMVEGQNYTQALVEASREGHLPIVQILLEKGAVISAEVMGAALSGKQTEVLLTLLDHGGNIGELNVRDAQGRSLCHHAATQGSIAKLKLLVMLGVDLTATDKQGRNCLHHAASNSHYRPRAVTWLLEQGFDPNTPDRDGWTPLHWVAKCRYRRLGSQRTIDILENAGAKFSHESIMGWTPNDVALFHNHKITWRNSSALSSNIGRSKPILEYGISTASPGRNARGVGAEALPRQIHWYQSCDGCSLLGNNEPPIYGPRHRCITCLDSGRSFDYCFKCKQSSEDTHPGHIFILVPSEEYF